ncbi:hypothetical protein EVAR_80149_1 [Eumeta japonica]|uniref:Uncharacterized protein n=1 Tax=Eumeta variegata TaxID=151549 RepID=A0A4C1YJ81_EUMVA|nr:hypothetical protein EVAR_80149_1 [Eumeta japonica]
MGLPRLQTCCFVFDLKPGNIIMGCLSVIASFVITVLLAATLSQIAGVKNSKEYLELIDPLGPEIYATLAGQYALTVIVMLVFLFKTVLDVVFVYGIVKEHRGIIKTYLIIWIVVFFVSVFAFFFSISGKHYASAPSTTDNNSYSPVVILMHVFYWDYQLPSSLEWMKASSTSVIELTLGTVLQPQYYDMATLNIWNLRDTHGIMFGRHKNAFSMRMSLPRFHGVWTCLKMLMRTAAAEQTLGLRRLHRHLKHDHWSMMHFRTYSTFEHCDKVVVADANDVPNLTSHNIKCEMISDESRHCVGMRYRSGFDRSRARAAQLPGAARPYCDTLWRQRKRLFTTLYDNVQYDEIDTI